MRKIILVLQIAINVPFRLFSKISILAFICKSTIHQTVAVLSNTRIYWSTIGRYTYLSKNCWIINADIGSFCSIASNVMIGGGKHPLNHVSTSPVFYSKKNVLKTCFAEVNFGEYDQTSIGNDVWIGTNAFIKGGVTIGHGAVIGAYSVVTKNVEPYSIVGGNPAKLIRKRFDDSTIEKLLKSQWWNYSNEILREKAAHFGNVVEFLHFQD